MNKLLFPCAAIALITMSASAHAGKIEVGTIAVSLGLGFGNTVAQTYGSQANASTTNQYKASARAGSQQSSDENGVVTTSESENGRLIWSTEAHASVKNSSTSSVKYDANAKARGFSLGAGWGAFTWSFNQPVHSEGLNSIGAGGGTFDRSGAIAGGLSGSYSESQGKASASGTGTGDATADATNGRDGQSSSSSATGGATSTASAGGNTGYSSNTSGGASIGVASSY